MSDQEDARGKRAQRSRKGGAGLSFSLLTEGDSHQGFLEVLI